MNEMNVGSIFDAVMGFIVAAAMVWGVGYLIAGWLDQQSADRRLVRDSHRLLIAHINHTQRMIEDLKAVDKTPLDE